MTEITITKYISREGDILASIEIPDSNSLEPLKTNIYIPKPEEGDKLNFVNELYSLQALLRRAWELGKEGEEIEFANESLVVD